MKKYLAEFIGTFSLVLFGCGAAVVAGKTIPVTVADAPTGIGLLGISLAFGFAVVEWLWLMPSGQYRAAILTLRLLLVCW